MSGTRLRGAAIASALGLGAALAAIVILYHGHVPAWSVPALAAAALVVCELADLGRSVAPGASVERPALTAVLARRLLVAALLATASGAVALLAAAVPARYSVATGLLGAAAAATLFLLVGAIAPRPDPR